MSKNKECHKSSGKRMTASQRDAKKLASILKSSHWAVVCQWDGFVPFAQSELDNELEWAKSQIKSFQEVNASGKEQKKIETFQPQSQLRKELKVQQKMLAEERKILARQTTDEGRTARARNVEILSQRCFKLEAEIRPHSTSKEWVEWNPVPVKPLGFKVKASSKAKPKPKLKAKKSKSLAPKPVTKSSLKAFRQRKAEELRLQRVENAAREAAKKAAAEYVAQRASQVIQAAKAKAAAEKARKRAEAKRRKAQEERLFNRVFELTLNQFDLDRMVREEVARQLAAA